MNWLLQEPWSVFAAALAVVVYFNYCIGNVLKVIEHWKSQLWELHLWDRETMSRIERKLDDIIERLDEGD